MSRLTGKPTGRPSRVNWAERDAEIIPLLKQKLPYPEIARRMGLTPPTVQLRAKRLGMLNGGKFMRKHEHLRGAVFRYFMKHSWDETREHFDLTQSELKSIFTVGYRDGRYKHLRKDKRRKDPVSVGQYKTMLRYSGYLPRVSLAQRSGRGASFHAVKERLQGLGVTRPMMLGGLPVTIARSVLGPEIDERLPFITGIAGPRIMKFSLCPWVEVSAYVKRRRNVDPLFKKYASIMAKFQRWIWDGRSNDSIKRSIKYAIASEKKRQAGSSKIKHENALGKARR